MIYGMSFSFCTNPQANHSQSSQTMLDTAEEMFPVIIESKIIEYFKGLPQFFFR